MARQVHPSHTSAHDPHAAPKPGRTGHDEASPGKPGEAPARENNKGFGRRAADNVSDAVEGWANRRSNNPHGSSGVGRAARNAIGAVTKGAQAASSPLHNQDPYHVASVTGEAMSAASGAFNLAKTHAGDMAAHAASAAFKSRKPGRAAPHAPHADHNKSPAHSPEGAHASAHAPHEGPKPAFGGAKPNRHADTTARDALGSAAAHTQQSAKTNRSPPAATRDTGPEIE